jgi:hypothetical protein
VVFADQTAENLPSLDPGGDIHGMPGLSLRRFLLQALVRSVPVVMPGVLGQDAAEVPLAKDQHVVQAFAAQRAHEPLRERVRPRRPDRCPYHPRAIPGEDPVECGGELAVPVADQEPELPGPLAAHSRFFARSRPAGATVPITPRAKAAASGGTDDGRHRPI